jgi:hypothetical protein
LPYFPLRHNIPDRVHYIKKHLFNPDAPPLLPTNPVVPSQEDRLMQRWFIPFALMLLATYSEAATHPEASKAPWEWTDAERLGARFDPASIRERSAARQPNGATAVRSTATPTVQVSVANELPNFVSGARNPELLMPFELFSTLVERGFSANQNEQQMYRRAIGPAIAHVTSNTDAFWTSLEVASRPYIGSVRQERELALKFRQVSTEDERLNLRHQISALQQPQCALRAAALESATKSLGKNLLYRVLYEAIAPTMTVSAPASDIAARYLFVAGGCR